MKRVTTLGIMILLTVISCTAFSNQNNSILIKRRQAIENLNVYKTTITDSTSESLKGLVKAQEELISADKPIIDGYLDSLQTKADSLKRAAGNVKNDKEALEKEAKVNQKLFLYGIIGGGVLLVGFILFLILFLMANSKKSKLQAQISGIDKIKKDNQYAIDKAKKELEVMKANAQKEIATAKENVAKEVKNLQAKIDSQSAEKANLEKRINEKVTECSQLQLQITTIKNDCEKKLKEASSNVPDFSKEKLLLEKEVFDKTQLLDNITKERDAAKKELSDYKELAEKESRERKSLEEKLADTENELKNIPVSVATDIDAVTKENERLREKIISLDERINEEMRDKRLLEEKLLEKDKELKNIATPDTNIESLKRDNELLKEDLDILQGKLDKEIQTKNTIEEELRRFIDELRNIR
jgi:chromosome segregation ATPase